MKKGSLTIKIIGLILLTDFLESTYEFLFKKGMLLVGEFNFSDLSRLGDFIVGVATCGWIWTGLAILAAELFLWFFILSKIDLSLAFPISSTSYIYVLLVSVFLLHENVGLNRWLGTLIIIAGIYLIARSAQEKKVLPKTDG
jgi:drug/metabolite transporter (DMT)-like permease